MGTKFDAVFSENEGVYSPILPGVYNVNFESLEEKETQSGGESWSAKMKIEGSNRTFFLNWNVTNNSEVAQRIAREQISQIAKLLGVEKNISIDTIKTNKTFTITLEQRVVGDKTYYQTKGPWKLADNNPKSIAEGIKKVQDAMAPVKKNTPWAKN